MTGEENQDKSRIVLIGILVERTESVASVNEILHQYGTYIIGRMGIPYREKKVNVISIVMDAPNDVVSAVSGRLGQLPGVQSKALYARKN
ncbi:MAG: iron-only hydrogenase system regulator [Clostridiales bacterium]|nr:iron-only hydrogenase system regulator [Clostridiales bacterium]